MKQAVVIFIVLLTSVISINAVQAGNLLQDVTLTTLDGSIIEFNALNGTPMVINIGADW